jgi:two-component sensor histidine kinase
VNIADRAYFQYHATHPNDELVISLIKRRTDGQWAIALSRRVNNADGSFAGIGGAGIKPELFRTFFQTLNVGKHGYIILKSKSNLLAQIGQVSDIPYIDSIQTVPGYDLSVIVALDKNETLQSWWNSAYINLVALGTTLVLMSLLGYRLIVQIRIRAAAEAGLFEATRFLEQRVIDRTAALRAAVVQRDNLLREVFHRVKNNMQVVDGLLYLKIKDSHEAQALHDMRLLIHAINLAHDYLMETRDYETFDIAPFLINLVKDVGSQWSDEIVDITVSPMRVDVDYAVQIGLLLT